MSLGTLTDNLILHTQEDIFLGLRVECVPPLNFQVQMEHGKPFSEVERQRINFGPLIKETPFEKEKKLKESIKEPPPPVLLTKQVTIVEIEPPPIRKVAFYDERLPAGSLTGISSSLNRLEANRTPTSILAVASDKSTTMRSLPKGILKSKLKSKYNRSSSNQSSSQNSKSTQFTHSYSFSPKGRKLSTFSRFHELNKNYVQSDLESDDYSQEDSFGSFDNQFSEENLDPLAKYYNVSGWEQQRGQQHQQRAPPPRKKKY